MTNFCMKMRESETRKGDREEKQRQKEGRENLRIKLFDGGQIMYCKDITHGHIFILKFLDREQVFDIVGSQHPIYQYLTLTPAQLQF